GRGSGGGGAFSGVHDSGTVQASWHGEYDSRERYGHSGHHDVLLPACGGTTEAWRADRTATDQRLSLWRWRISLDLSGPGSIRVGDVEARIVEGGQHRASAATSSSHVRRLH